MVDMTILSLSHIFLEFQVLTDGLVGTVHDDRPEEVHNETFYSIDYYGINSLGICVPKISDGLLTASTFKQTRP